MRLLRCQSDIHTLILFVWRISYFTSLFYLRAIASGAIILCTAARGWPFCWMSQQQTVRGCIRLAGSWDKLASTLILVDHENLQHVLPIHSTFYLFIIPYRLPRYVSFLPPTKQTQTASPKRTAFWNEAKHPLAGEVRVSSMYVGHPTAASRHGVGTHI